MVGTSAMMSTPHPASGTGMGTSVVQPFAATQAVLMTVYRTPKLLGHDPRHAIADTLTAYAASGTLPPLPEAIEYCRRVTSNVVELHRSSAYVTQHLVALAMLTG